MSLIEADLLDMEEMIADLGDHPGELFFQFDIEEEECYRVLLVMIWIDPITELVASEVLMDAVLEKELDAVQ